MPASSSYLISKLFNLHKKSITHHESLLIGSLFFTHLHEELSLRTNQIGSNMENNSTIRNLINDLLTSNEYTIDGLATYTGFPGDIIYDIAAGININPTLSLAIKIIELHIMYRQDLYNDIVKKVTYNFS